jgi:hypothetical protein
MASKLGVDVSKAKLDVALLIAGAKFCSKVFANDGPGFKSLLAWIEANVPGGKLAAHVCMEDTAPITKTWRCSAAKNRSWRWASGNARNST